MTVRAAQAAPRAKASAQPPSAQAKSPTPPPASPRSIVNRTPPRITPPPQTLAFSAQPTDREISGARIFAEPLVPIGRATFPEENRALAAIVSRYLATGDAEAVLPFWGFLKRFPDSPWQASLQLNLGLTYRRTGYFSRALDVWETLWTRIKDAPDPRAKPIADRTLGELLELHARLGRFDRLEPLIAEADRRSIIGRATEQITAAREGLWLMKNRPDQAFRCGPLAVDSILTVLRAGYRRGDRIINSASTTKGTSLAQMQELAASLDLPMQMARRDAGARVLLPALVHWRAGHFAALVREEGGRYLVRDPTFGDESWISKAALDDEATGFMLVQPTALPAGWRAVSREEGEEIWGKGQTNGNDPTKTRPCDTTCGCGGGGICMGGGMPVATAHLMVVSLSLRDMPVGYTPPRGPDMHFILHYNQRDAYQPQTFPFSHVGPKWTFDWLSYIEDDPSNANAVVNHQVRGGGRDVYQGFNPATQQFTPEPLSGAVLVRTSSSPIRYERRMNDGSVEVFAQPDGALVAPRRVFMTEWHAAAGNVVTYTYDAQARLVAAIDALGQVTTLVYADPGDPRRITQVTDPFGRSASMTYDAAGRLQSITDAIGLTSSFTYDAGDFIVALTTPYGTSRFAQGANGQDRWLEMTDPLGGKERIEYRVVSPTIASSDPASTVPSGPGVSFENQYLQYRNTFYWDKRAMAVAPRDPASAHIYHWLHTSGPLNQTSGVLESEKKPLEARTWYRYPGQSSAIFEGTSHQPSVIARVLDDGMSNISRVTYSANNNVTSRTDPLGRRTAYTYAANGVDVAEVRQTTGALNELLATFSNYTTDHRPQTIVDAAGETSTFTYNTSGQILTTTNAKGETTTHTYDATDGVLLTVTGPVAGATVTYTYDAVGRLHTSTDADGYTVTTTYDAFDRPVTVTYPDGTTEEMIYNRLDLAEVKDRLGRRTKFFYDALRRLVATRDPLGRTVTREWCICGSLDALVDAKGQRTRWERDVQARVLREIRPDGVPTRSYTYEQTNGRIKTVTDAKLQVATLTYNVDDTVQSIVHTGSSIPTATVSYTHDPNYPRLATMTDGLGTTTYAYKPVGVAGAGALASIDGPFANDIQTYEYDELGRATGVAIDGVGTTVSIDALGRVDTEVTPIGTFTTTYDGTTERTSVITYPNGQTSTYTYFGNLGDRAIESLRHQLSGGATLSSSAFTYDAIGRVTTWEYQAGGAAPTVLTAGYDDANELTRASIAAVSAPTTPLKRYAFGYDAASNRTSAQVDDAITQSSYDILNRLTERRDGGPIRIAGSVNEPATVTVQGAPAATAADGSFRGQAQVASGTTVVAIAATDASGNSATQSYEIDAGSATSTFTYDANGNLLSDGVRTFEWDARNRVVSITEGTKRSEFTYDGSSRMVRLVERQSAVITEEYVFVWCGTELCERRDATGATVQIRFYKHGFQEAGVAYFYTRDHLSSVREVTDGTNAVRARYEYDPFGKMTKVAGDHRSPIGYTGMYIHEASGLNLTLFRVYDAALGRWLSEDPIGFAGGLNLYAYVGNQLFTHIDPLGLNCVEIARSPGITWLVRVTRDPTSKWKYEWAKVQDPERTGRGSTPFGTIQCFWTRRVHITRYWQKEWLVFGMCQSSCYRVWPAFWTVKENWTTTEDYTERRFTLVLLVVGDIRTIMADWACQRQGPPN